MRPFVELLECHCEELRDEESAFPFLLSGASKTDTSLKLRMTSRDYVRLRYSIFIKLEIFRFFVHAALLLKILLRRVTVELFGKLAKRGNDSVRVIDRLTGSRW